MLPELTDDCIVRLRRGVVVRDFNGRVLVLPSTGTDVVEVRDVAADVLRACRGPLRFGAVRNALPGHPETARFSTVVQLAACGWLELLPETGGGDQTERHVGRSAGSRGSDGLASSVEDAAALLDSIAPRLPTATSSDAWLAAVAVQRVLPIAALAHRRERLMATEQVASPAEIDKRCDQLERAARDRVAWSMMVERSGSAAVEALSSAGVRSLLLKGLATAHLDYPEPSWRELGDVDVLVHPDDVRAADAALRQIAEPAEHVTDGLRLRNKERVFVDFADVEIDVHHRLIEDPYGFAVRVDELFESSESFSVSGVDVAALGAAHRLAHAVAHWASSGPVQRRASGLLDVVLLCRRPDVAQDARRALAGWSLGSLAAAVPELVGVDERDRSRVLGSLFAHAYQGSRVAAELGAIGAQPTLGGAARELRSRLFPGDELMALHGVTRTRRLVRFAWHSIARNGADRPR